MRPLTFARIREVTDIHLDVRQVRSPVQPADGDVAEGFNGNAGQDIGGDERGQNSAQHGQFDVFDSAFPDLLLDH